VLDVLANPDEYLKARQQRADSEATTQELAEIEHELRQLDARKRRGFDAYDVGVISLDEYREHRDKITKRTQELQSRRAVLQSNEAQSNEIAAWLAFHAAMIDEWRAAPPDRWHDLLVGIVQVVIITRGSETDIRLL